MIRIHTKYIFYTTYCKDYYSIITNTESRNYDRIIEVNGEPDKITREKIAVDYYMIQLAYNDGRLFVFPEYKNADRMLLEVIEFTNPKYRFGRKKIGIGTDKSTIEKVYRNSYQGLEESLYGGYDVEDGNCSLLFYFDDNDIVNKIVVGRAEIMHGTQGWKRVKK